MERPPDRPGVYFLVEPDRELRYIGKATSLRSRLGEHRRSGKIAASTTVYWEEHPSEQDAEARESDLIVFLKPLGFTNRYEKRSTLSPGVTARRSATCDCPLPSPPLVGGM